MNFKRSWRHEVKRRLAKSTQREVQGFMQKNPPHQASCHEGKVRYWWPKKPTEVVVLKRWHY